MNRKIKFRVYSNYYKKYLDTSGEGIYCEVHHLALKPDGKLYYADIGIEYAGTRSECPTLKWEEDYDDCVVEQCTGLKDKNGKEIYEGDILEFTKDPVQAAVIWSQSHAEFQIKWLDCKVDDSLSWHLHDHGGAEVIGNIHENPELLGGEE